MCRSILSVNRANLSKLAAGAVQWLCMHPGCLDRRSRVVLSLYWSLCCLAGLVWLHAFWFSLSPLSCQLLPGRRSLWAPALGPHTCKQSPVVHQLVCSHYLRQRLGAPAARLLCNACQCSSGLNKSFELSLCFLLVLIILFLYIDLSCFVWNPGDWNLYGCAAIKCGLCEEGDSCVK